MFTTRRNKLAAFLLIALSFIHCGNSSTTPSTTSDDSNNSNNGLSTTTTKTTKQAVSSTLTTPSTTKSSQENNNTNHDVTDIANNSSTQSPGTSNTSSSNGSSTANNKTTVTGSTVTQTPTTTVSVGSSNKPSPTEKSTLNTSQETTPQTSVATPNGTNHSVPAGTTQAPPVTKQTTLPPTSTVGGSTTVKSQTTVAPSTTMAPNENTPVQNTGTSTLTPEVPGNGSATTQNKSTPVPVTTSSTTNQTKVPPTVSPTNKTSNRPTSTLPVTTTIPPTTTMNQTTTGITSTSTGTTNNPTTTHVNTPVTGSPGTQFVYINEIIVNKQGIFQKIEIQTSSQLDLTHYAIVMVDGSTNKTLSVFYLRNGNKTKPGLLMVQFNSSSTLSNKGVGIAIYDTRNLTSGNSFTEDWNVNEAGLIDALVIGKTYEDISASLVNILTPGVDPFILDPSKYGQDRSISRCSNGAVRSTEMYAFINPSMGNDNHVKCTEREQFQNTLSIKMKMDCGQLRYANNTINEHLMRQIIKLVVRDVNRKCQCGITRMHVVDPIVQCCTDTVLDMKFVAPNKLQDKEFLQSFKAFIANTDNIEVNDQSYSLDQTCLNDCCNQVIQPLSKKDNSKDIRVTVAVIVTLLVLFLIIVLVVYMYMRKKKMAVQQFRMSRLEEDYEDFDDMTVGISNDDHDEFVGGQEATFDLKA